MTPPAAASQGVGAGVTAQQAQQTTGLSPAAIQALVRAGFVAPSHGPGRAWRFSFRDLALMRTAHALHEAGVPRARVLRSLARLRAALPADLPMSGLRITAAGAQVVVHDRTGAWLADNGQRLMAFDTAFDAAGPRGRVALLPTARKAGSGGGAVQEATRLCHEAEALEATDPAAAEQAYRHALALDPRHLPGWLNLGALLCDARRSAEALVLYEAALRQGIQAAPIHFNHAIALEDQGHLGLAVAAYERTLELDPACADAHYNAGRLLQRLGQAQAAWRHLGAYRRIVAAQARADPPP